MQCLNCGHHNDGGKFCVKCGKKLEAVAAQQVAAGVEAVPTQQPAQQQPIPNYSQQQVPQQPNQHVENAKKISKLYIGYFMQGLKNPTATAQGVRGEQFINGLITMILFAISIPLMIYLGIDSILDKVLNKFSVLLLPLLGSDFIDLREDLKNVVKLDFTDIVIINGLISMLCIGAIALVTFGAVKLAKVNVSIQDVFARFGAFLIAPTAVMLVGVVFALLKISLFSYILGFGILGLFLTVAFTILSFKHSDSNGLDSVYGTLLTYIVMAILLVLFGRHLIEAVVSSLGSNMQDTFGDW